MSELELDLKEAEFLKRKQVLDNISELYYLVLAGADIEVSDTNSVGNAGVVINDYEFRVMATEKQKRYAKLIEEQGAVDL